MNEIGLQDLIYQVKRELLAPNKKEESRDPNPLFFIEKIELEIAVTISRSSSGEIRLTVLDFAQIGGNRAVNQEQSHVVKVSLSSLQPREEILRNISLTTQGEENQRKAYVKGNDDGILGQPS